MSTMAWQQISKCSTRSNVTSMSSDAWVESLFQAHLLNSEEVNSSVGAEITPRTSQQGKSTSTITKAGWCLREGLQHICQVDSGRMRPLVERFGIPSFYSLIKKKQEDQQLLSPDVVSTEGASRHEATQNIKDPSTCFESLCRIIVGQFVSGASAQATWKKLLAVTHQNLTPLAIQQLVRSDPTKELTTTTSSPPHGKKDIDEKEIFYLEERLQKPVGLSRAKARSILDLAQHFVQGNLIEETLCDPDRNEESLRQDLLAVRGLGPWSCDMFLLFYLERPNILPWGDLGVRKGLIHHFSDRLSASAELRSPSARQAVHAREQLNLYEPYLSLVTYYMWRVADIPHSRPRPAPNDNGSNPSSVSSPKNKRRKASLATTPTRDPSTPSPRPMRRRVTP